MRPCSLLILGMWVFHLRPMTKKDLAETGDGTKKMMAEFANVILNRDAHAVVGGVGK